MRIAGIAVAVLACLASQPLWALDCVTQTIQETYWAHEEARDTYMLVYGSFAELKMVDRLAMDPATEPNATAIEIWTATFEGNRASRRAFDQPFAAKVMLILPDYSKFEGAGAPADEVRWIEDRNGLVWLKQTDAGLEVRSSICGSVIDADPAHVKPALRCLRGGYCPKPD